MSDIFKALESIKKYKINPDKIYIEEPLFRLFSRVTVASLILSAGLVTMQTLVGDKLKCILPPKEDVRQEALNQYCFIMSTYTVPNLYNKTVGAEVAHYGVGPYNPGEDEQRYHYYYQWVPFALFLQAFSFLLPHQLWKIWEGQKIKLICDLDIAPKIKMKQRGLVGEKETDGKKNAINKAAVYFVENIRYDRTYPLAYTACEVLNIIVVLLNFWFTNRFLSNSFHNYGPKVVQYLRVDPDLDSDQNPMNQVFPKVAKCDFNKYGPSGTIIRYDIMCVLALNIINEKIYLFLWFWFIILLAVGGFQLIYRVVLMISPKLRKLLLKRKVSKKFTDTVSTILQESGGYSEWFTLHLLSVNIDTLRFGELCDHIKTLLQQKSPNGRISSISPTPSFTKKYPSTGSDDAFKPLV